MNIKTLLFKSRVSGYVLAVVAWKHRAQQRWAAGIVKQLRAAQELARQYQLERNCLRRENDERRAMITWLLEKGFQFEMGGRNYVHSQRNDLRVNFSEPACAEELRQEIKTRREHCIGFSVDDMDFYAHREALHSLPGYIAEALAAHVMAAMMQAQGNTEGEVRARTAVATQKKRPKS